MVSRFHSRAMIWVDACNSGPLQCRLFDFVGSLRLLVCFGDRKANLIIDCVAVSVVRFGLSVEH